MMKLAYTRNESEYAIESTVDDDTTNAALDMVAESFGIPRASVVYLMHYGLKQSLQDAAAQPASEAKAEEDATAESIAAAISGAMAKRFDAIKSGTVAVRGSVGATRDPFESMVRRVAVESLTAYAKSKGKKLPKDADAKSAVVAKFLAANRPAIESEAKARLAATNVVEVVDIEL